MKKILLLTLLLFTGCVTTIEKNESAPVNRSAPSMTAGDSDLSEQILALSEENTQLKQQMYQLNLSLEHYHTELLAYQEMFRGACTSNGSVFHGQAKLDAPAVKQRIEKTGNFPFVTQRIITEGQMLTISVETTEGKGRVLVVTNPRMGTIFQDAANTAIIVAEHKTGKSIGGSDVIFSVNGSEILGVDGPSAGALMTTLLIGALEGKYLNNSVTMTGTISQNGNIGPISGVVEKAGAAKEAGKTLLVLSKSNDKLIKWEEQTEHHGSITYVTKVPVKINTSEYIKENVGIEVVFVETIADAIPYFME
ncbi:ATP-dependent protease [archaeon]|nr:ATP-dependent protease [archaeon]